MHEWGLEWDLHAVRGAADAQRSIDLNEAVTGEGGICERLPLLIAGAGWCGRR